MTLVALWIVNMALKYLLVRQSCGESLTVNGCQGYLAAGHVNTGCTSVNVENTIAMRGITGRTTLWWPRLRRGPSREGADAQHRVRQAEKIMCWARRVSGRAIHRIAPASEA